MLLPYGTDAPGYHFPFATIVIIAINTAMFIATGMGDTAMFIATAMGDYADARWLILEFDRINPLQWLTAAFMHASWIHLIGNMIFLWCFGLVVEGKLGSVRFSWLYIGLALANGAIGQIPMFMFSDGQGGALGASGVIFALIAVSVVWAPFNDIHFVFAWALFYIGTVEIPIYAVALFYTALEFLHLWFIGFQMSTPMLHLLGLAIGFPFAVFMLKHDLVDCEGWDLFTRTGLSLEHKRPPNVLLVIGRLVRDRSAADRPKSCRQSLKSESRRDIPESVRQDADESKLVRLQRDRCATAVESFEQAVRASKLKEAIACAQPLLRHSWMSAVPDSTLVAYIKLLNQNARQLDCLVPLRHLVARRSKCANEACLRIASIEIKYNFNPSAALAVLKEMPLPLDDRARGQRNQIIQVARRKMHAGRTDEPLRQQTSKR